MSKPLVNPFEGLEQKLMGNCGKCSGLCCTALYFSKAEGFPQDKQAGIPCKNLLHSFRCAVHNKLLPNGLKGCVAYDCFGAGQLVTQGMYHGENWQSSPMLAAQIFEVFPVVFRLRQMIWYLYEAASLPGDSARRAEVLRLIEENGRLTELTPEALLQTDVESYRVRVNTLLKTATGQKEHEKPALFMGKRFHRKNLDGGDFTMACLIAADLSGCSLRGVSFLGADLRDTNLCGADLSESRFLTRMQLHAAKGNSNTKLPVWLSAPASWQQQSFI